MGLNPPPSSGDRPPDTLKQAIALRIWVSAIGVGISWLVLGGLSLWWVRDEIALLNHYFTWVGLRYAIVYNRPAAIALSFCIGLTLAELIWLCRYMVWGLPPRQEQELQTWFRATQKVYSRSPFRKRRQ